MKLKPCPFCGGSNVHVEQEKFPVVACSDCGCVGPSVGLECDAACSICGSYGPYVDKEYDAVCAWNTRANTDEDEELIIVNDITLKG